MEYLAGVGRSYGTPAESATGNDGRRRDLIAAMAVIRRCERDLFRLMLDRVQTIKGLTVYGITDPSAMDQRCRPWLLP